MFFPNPQLHPSFASTTNQTEPRADYESSKSNCFLWTYQTCLPSQHRGCFSRIVTLGRFENFGNTNKLIPLLWTSTDSCVYWRLSRLKDSTKHSLENQSEIFALVTTPQARKGHLLLEFTLWKQIYFGGESARLLIQCSFDITVSQLTREDLENDFDIPSAHSSG